MNLLFRFCCQSFQTFQGIRGITFVTCLIAKQLGRCVKTSEFVTSYFFQTIATNSVCIPAVNRTAADLL